jgi:hypothetical protein
MSLTYSIAIRHILKSWNEAHSLQMQQGTNCELCGYWPQSFATQIAYPVTVDDNNYKDRCFHWPVTSSVVMITDYLLVHLINFETFSTFWWHLTLLSVYLDDIWLFIFAYTRLFISTSGDMWSFASVFSWHFPSVHFDYTWLFISSFWWYCSLSVYFDGTWLYLTLLSVHLVICDSLQVHFDDNLTLCECILITLDSSSVHFDDTGLCQCILMALDSAWLFYQYIW